MTNGSVCVGDSGTAATDLRPGGMVLVDGKRYSSRSNGPLIHSGEAVVIVSSDISGFIVQPSTTVPDPGSLPRFGKPVHANFVEKVAAKAAAKQEASRRYDAMRERWIRRTGPAIGALCAAIAVLLAGRDLWGAVSPSALGALPSFALAAAGLLGLGALSGLVTLRQVDRWLRGMDASVATFSLPTTFLFLMGAAVGGAWALPRWGIGWGCITALACAILCGIPLPVIALAIFASADDSGGDGLSGDVEGGSGEPASSNTESDS